MKGMLLATAATACVAVAATAQETANIGIILGFTGPLETMTPHMAGGAEIEFQEANDSGLLPVTLNPIRADSTCIDAAAASAAAERLVTSDQVAAIMGADCSGVTIAIANGVAIPNGVPMISPSATSPALSTIEDNDLFFRTSPSDARQGEIIANLLMERGIEEVAITYTNNDYGLGLAEAFQQAYEAAGGTVAISSPHEDGRGDYSAEVAALQASGADTLAVFGYVDQGGRGIVQAALDTGAFDQFVFGDGMYGDSIIEAIGSELDGNVIGAVPGSQGEGRELFTELAGDSVDPTGAYAGESYDAAALIALAVAKAGSADRAAIAASILEVANAPGDPILPGELARGIEILQSGGDVDYQGATGVELIGPGEAAGSYRIYEIQNGTFETVEYR